MERFDRRLRPTAEDSVMTNTPKQTAMTKQLQTDKSNEVFRVKVFYYRLRTNAFGSTRDLSVSIERAINKGTLGVIFGPSGHVARGLDEDVSQESSRSSLLCT